MNDHSEVWAAMAAAEATASDWPDPTPLPDALPPVQPFAPELMPEALRGWVVDIAHRMQCPPDFPAVGAVAALSSLVGARAVVQPKAHDDWQVVPNLWALIVGRPGVMKSPALGEALKPLLKLQAAEVERHNAAHRAWALDSKLAELQSAEREKQAKGLAGKVPVAARALLEPVDTTPEPVARRYIVNDPTVEKLGELLMVNPWGTLIYRDEMHGLLTAMDKPGAGGVARLFPAELRRESGLHLRPHRARHGARSACLPRHVRRHSTGQSPGIRARCGIGRQRRRWPTCSASH